MEQEIKGLDVTPVDKDKIKKIWKVTAILFLATVVEFIIAFTVGAGAFKTTVFILLTIFKAFYIIGEFMHLSHEKKGLVWMIVAPTVFLMWLIAAFWIQGEAIFQAIFGS
ncbi:cytochrome C oxidase subunit IV family protein [Reichenbachiella agariperforans]|uniref:cytochrome C oxidase subunit IV family protein n=1 Tax=Reichenbachiella agariperforans TaxID=156994 RepID=UPI001C08C700|nr:cytochrome C oxidase subunit IV family protein [Reichenbachiella agariperforans]MBU2915343.1 cytochrome C oxidase subunit IV family protein [Reichenbachiella agariperforans]